MRVYIVVGHTGEYEDRCEWNAFAFTSLEKAESKMKQGNELLNKMRDEINLERGCAGFLPNMYTDKIEEHMRDNFDKACSIDYTGSYYTVEELDVEVENE